MSRSEEWNEFLGNLIACASEKLQATKEYEYQRQRQEQIDEILTTNLTANEKDLVDQVLFEFGLAAEHETELLYRQGFQDCVWLLKNLGVLS